MPMPFIPSGPRAVIVTCLVFLFVAVAFPVAQQPPPTFRTGVEAVVLDVSVLDRDRMPVRGLTASDFTIFEDGSLQTLKTFAAIDIPEPAPTPSAPWVREIAPDVERNDHAVTNGRVVVIVLDDANPMGARDELHLKPMARRVVEQLGPNDQAAVVHVLNAGAGQEFTRDRTLLLAAVDRFGASILLDAVNFNACLQMVGVLRGQIQGLGLLPQRRKALIFASVGCGVDLEMFNDVAAGHGTQGLSGLAAQVLFEVSELYRIAQRANVSIYGLDPGGLRVTTANKPNIGFLKGLSENTGGFAVVDTNDPQPGIAQILRENASYYLLGYQSTNPRADGRYRKIDVRVARDGVTVRSRKGYVEPRASDLRATPPTKSPAESSYKLALAPETGIGVAVSAAPFAVAGSRNAALVVVVGAVQPRDPNSAGRVVEKTGVLVEAYDPGGRRRASEAQTVSLTVTPGREAGMAFELLSRLDVGPGRYRLQLAAENAVRGRRGTAHYDVDVPDFGGLPLSVSGLLLSTDQAAVVAAKDKLVPLIPVVPTVQRDFVSTDRVTAFLRVYQGGTGPLAAVAVRTSIVDARGMTVIDRAETLGPDRFGPARAADYRLELPLVTLAKGPYLVSITATRGTLTARRDVRITVR
jgi:VWFA-related protein